MTKPTFECDCSCYCDEVVEICVETWQTARKPHKCCECGDTIKPGSRYLREFTALDGKCNTHKTCAPCHSIRTAYCPSGFEWGNLVQQIFDCLGFDYRQNPSEWSQSDVDKEDEVHRERALMSLAKQREAQNG